MASAGDFGGAAAQVSAFPAFLVAPIPLLSASAVLRWTAAMMLLVVPAALIVRALWRNLRAVRRLQAMGLPEEKPYSLLFGHILNYSAIDYGLCDHVSPLLEGSAPEMLNWHHPGKAPFKNPLMVLRRFLLSEPRIFVADPKALNCIFLSNSYKFVKPRLGRVLLRNIIGELGLLTLEHDLHRKHRRLINPIFNMKNLKLLVPDFVSCFEEFRDYLISLGDQDALPFHALASRATLSALGRTAMGDDFEALSETSPAADVYETLTTRGSLKLSTLLRLFVPEWIQAPFAHREVRAILTLDKVVRRIIQRNREEASGNALAQILVRSAEAAELSEEELKCEIATFLAAGHETSSGVLISTMLQLALYPDVQDKLYEELSTQLTDLSDYDTLQRLPLLNNVLAETQRLFPVAYFTVREACQDVEMPTSSFGTIHVPKGTTVVVPIRSIHLFPHIWGPDADQWRPDRWKSINASAHSIGVESAAPDGATTSPLKADFIEGAGKKENGTSSVPPTERRTLGTWDYVPFLGGPRGCIGRQFALMELRIYVAGLVRAFRVHTELKPGEVKMGASITAKPRNAYLRFAPRLKVDGMS